MASELFRTVVGAVTCLLLPLIFFWSGGVKAQADFFSLKQRHAFAQSLYDLGDYQGARKEWLFLLNLKLPASESLSVQQQDSLYFLLGQCAFKQGDLTPQAIQNGFYYYSRISLQSPVLFNHSRIAEGYKRLLYDDPLEAVVPSLTLPADTAEQEHVYFQRCLVPLLVTPKIRSYRKWRDYRVSWEKYRELRAGFHPKSLVLRKALRQTDTIVAFFALKKEKSPALAGALALLIPGGGKAYLGNWGQATMIFFTTAMLGLVAYEGHYRHTDWQLYSFGTLTVGYHLFSVYSATFSIKIFNRDLRHHYRQAIRSGVAPVLDDVLLYR